MQFADYKKTAESNLPPTLEAGQILNKVTRIEKNTFQIDGRDVDGMRVFADGKEYKTSSKVVMEQLTKFFDANPKETLDNVKIVQPRGKRYLTLESV